MFAAVRSAPTARLISRSFSSTSAARDLSKVTLIGRLGADPVLRETKSGQPFYQYIVATQAPAYKNAEGNYIDGHTSWHTVFSYNPNQHNQLSRLGKGTTVYVEADMEMLKSEPIGDQFVPPRVSLKQINVRTVGQRVKPEHEEDGQEKSADA